MEDQGNTGSGLTRTILSTSEDTFHQKAMEVFRYQLKHNSLYRQYCESVHRHEENVRSKEDIPFLPISFFKTHEIKTGTFNPEAIFESSGTTGQIPSRHFIKDIRLYEESFTAGFRLRYGDPGKWCFLALLPSYLERKNSSLVYMADKLIQQSQYPQSGFYLDEHDLLFKTLSENERQQIPTLLLGVTFALLDFAAHYQMMLRHTIVMETGGMKGRRQEMSREKVHTELCERFGLDVIHSEYGMTELLSQAYSPGSGLFRCPPWMKAGIRERDDPFEITFSPNGEDYPISGAVNIIDLANISSCAFIATDDMGKIHPDGTFEITGRLDRAEMRGCSLMVE